MLYIRKFFTNLNLARPNRLAKKMVPVVVPVVVPPYFDRLPNMVIDIPKRKEIYNNTVLLQVLLQVLIFGQTIGRIKHKEKVYNFFIVAYVRMPTWCLSFNFTR